MDSHQEKAADLVVESLKSVLSLATLLFSGLLGLFTVRGSAPPLSAKVALGCLLVASLLSVISINTLINKVQRDEGDAIKKWDVRIFHLIAATALLAGLGIGAYAVLTTHAEKENPQGLPNTTIDNTSVRVGTAETGTVTVSKSPTGTIEKIVVTPAQ